MPWIIHPPLLSALLVLSLPACLSVRLHACHCVVVVQVGPDENGNICPKGPHGLPVASGSGHLAQ